MMATNVKYKKTGIDWMPEVPEHWEIRRLKQFSKIETGTTPPKIHASNYSEKGIPWIKPDNLNDFEPLIDSKEKISKDGLKGVRIIPKDSVLVCCIGTIGKIGIAGIDLTTNQQINSVIFNQDIVLPNFGRYLIFASEKEHWRLSTRSVVSILNKSTQGNIKFPIPPLEEQKAIADYLDIQSAKITRFIQSKQRFIELLKEQRQSIITNAVTKGIDDKVKMKETGIDWIPNIPKNWNKRRLRFLVKITTGKKNTEDRISDGEYPFYVRSQTIERINSYSFDGEGILTAGDGVGVGKVFHYVNEKFDFHQRVYLFYDFNKEIEGEFLFNYLQANMMSELMRYNSKSTVDSIRLPVIKNFLVVFPERQEQKRILEHIKTETRTLDIAISKAEREIALIKEYREAMIAEAVTGKMKL